MEKLAKAKEKFYESEVKRRNDEARRRAEILDANKDFEETNKALEDLKHFTRLMDDSVYIPAETKIGRLLSTVGRNENVCDDDDGCFGSW